MKYLLALLINILILWASEQVDLLAPNNSISLPDLRYIQALGIQSHCQGWSLFLSKAPSACAPKTISFPKTQVTEIKISSQQDSDIFRHLESWFQELKGGKSKRCISYLRDKYMQKDQSLLLGWITMIHRAGRCKEITPSS